MRGEAVHHNELPCGHELHLRCMNCLRALMERGRCSEFCLYNIPCGRGEFEQREKSPLPILRREKRDVSRAQIEQGTPLFCAICTIILRDFLFLLTNRQRYAIMRMEYCLIHPK